MTEIVLVKRYQGFVTLEVKGRIEIRRRERLEDELLIVVRGAEDGGCEKTGNEGAQQVEIKESHPGIIEGCLRQTNQSG